MMINVDIDAQELFNTLAECIEDTENTGLLYDILEWSIKELENYGKNSLNNDIQKGYKLLEVFNTLNKHKESIK